MSASVADEMEEAMVPQPDFEITPDNPPDWMSDLNPEILQRAAEIAAQLIEEGYSEEQAYEIALERLEEEGGGEEEEGFEDDIYGSPV
jgi:uncharacterized protein YdaT